MYMPSEETLLFLLTLAVVIGVPLYIFFRQKMVTSSHKAKVFSRKKVLKLTIINITLNILVSFYFFSFLVMVLMRNGISFTPTLIVSTLLMMAIMWVTFYGNGIYITSIVLEDFTLPQLRFDKAFKTQFIATHLFHGPISHFLIYSGWLFVLLILASLDIQLPLPKESLYWIPLIISGLILGTFYAVAQIYNGTAVYQFVSGVTALIIIFILLFISKTNISHLPITSYFLGCIIAFVVVLGSYVLYLTYRYIKTGEANWDTSGGQLIPDELKKHRLLQMYNKFLNGR
jgi:hypothetical protein